MMYMIMYFIVIFNFIKKLFSFLLNKYILNIYKSIEWNDKSVLQYKKIYII